MIETQETAKVVGSLAPMHYWRSLRFQVSLVFLLLFVTILVLGLASVWSLTASNEVSIDVRDRWLPNTRLLGDLNNYTSDYRTEEANSLLAASPEELNDSLHEIEVLSKQVAQAQRGYEAVAHNEFESDLYRRFSATWDAYRELARQVTTLRSTGRTAEAATLYRTRSRATYDTAEDLLGQLTDYNVIRAAQASERSARAYARAGGLLTAAVIVAALMLIFVVAQVRRSVSRPLLDLGLAMRALAANNTAIDVPHVRRDDEIGEMARAVAVFRENAVELARSQRGLAQQATMLEEKLAHEQELTRMRNDFVSMITHEFRTPLTHIDAQAQRLTSLRDRLDADDVTERAGRMRTAVARIVRLIDDLLNTSRVMAGEVNLFFHAELLDIAALLRDVSRAHREISPDALILEDIPSGPVPMIGDPRLLFQAMSNLVGNAIRYSPASARVKVSLSVLETMVRLEVTDEGIGIPARDLERVFTRFYRGSNVGGVVGTGIGLFFVATVVRLHRGEITVNSEEGKGSRFVITSPVGDVSAEARARTAAT